MDWPETIAKGLPNPRSGEPPSLRQDIIDELSDHLTCAMTREFCRTPDESQARKAVLARFGDPVRIACQLWLAAMKETIMKERIVMAGVVVAALACVVTAVVAWTAVRQNQAVNRAVLAKLESLVSRPNSESAPSDWVKVVVRLREGSADGPPVVGTAVWLNGDAFGTGECTLDGTTDASGMAMFGPIRPGRYDLSLTVQGLAGGEELTLYPRAVQEFVLVCPPADVWTRATIRVDWPEELPAGDLAAALLFSPVERTLTLDNRTWAVPRLYVVVGRDNCLLEKFFSSSSLAEQMLPSWDDDDRPLKERLEIGMMSEHELFSHDDAAGGPDEANDCVRAHISGYRLSTTEIWKRESEPGSGRTLRSKLGVDTYRRQNAPLFSSKPGASCSDSTWTIPLSPRLVEKVIAAAAESEADKPAGTP